jgi:predicted nucleic acid-binding protein
MSYIIDSGFLYARLNGKDFAHVAVSGVLLRESEPVYLPVPAITEVTFLLQRDLGQKAVWHFIESLNETNILLEAPTDSDYIRSAEILRKYKDQNIDFVDACIVAMAERLDIKTILTVDRRHFSIFKPKHCDSFELLPD